LKQLDDGEVDGISSGRSPSPTHAQVEAAKAIRAMGTNALPLLMQDIHLTPSTNALRFRLRGGLTAIARTRQSNFWRFLRDSIPDCYEEDLRRWRAAQGLAALGPLAKPALPELSRLLTTNHWHSAEKEAAYVLAAIGPEGVAVLTNTIALGAAAVPAFPKGSFPEWSTMCAIWALGQHPSVGTNVIPVLISATSSGSIGIACGSIQVLGLFRVDPEHVIPALTNALSSRNTDVRRDAIAALGAYGSQSACAGGLLQSLTNDATVRATAIEALERIRANRVRTN
jgi:hypothetical protein